MKRLLFCLELLFLTTVSFGQSNKNEKYIIRGYIYDSTSTTGLGYASAIVINHRKYSRSADKNGYFEIKLPSKFRKKIFIITIAAAGWAPYTVEINNKDFFFDRELIIRLNKHNYSTDPPSFTN